jgi:hypothetical protein
MPFWKAVTLGSNQITKYANKNFKNSFQRVDVSEVVIAAPLAGIVLQKPLDFMDYHTHHGGGCSQLEHY